MMDDRKDATTEKRDAIVRARLKLRERFQAGTAATPSVADPAPMGSGPRNRHGMPKLPVDQHQTHKWPVLDLGHKPEISRDAWQLTLDGACANPTTLSWSDFLELEQIEDVSDFHCVTGWSRMDIRWRGVRFADLAALAQPSDDAAFVMCHAYDRYTTNLSLTEALKPDVLLVYEADGEPLPVEHGGPVRMITPELYAWKGAKWIRRIEFMAFNRPGFWEEHGYSNTAYPWRNDRYG